MKIENQTILFDTLAYAKILRNGGVPNADIHAHALQLALSQNLFSKAEMTMTIEQALARVDRSIETFRTEMHSAVATVRSEMHSAISTLRTEMHQLELRVEKSINHTFNKTITILGTLMVVVGTFSAFASKFIH